MANWRLKLEVFERFGVLPGAGDRHLAEFFPNFITDASGWGERWGFGLTSIALRERHQDEHIAALDALLASDTVDAMPSGEMVAPVIHCLVRDQPGRFPLNIPNEGQVADLPLGAVVESMCIVDGGGVRGSEAVSLPAGMAEALRRVSASQELTVDAAVSGDRDDAFAAMLLDPLAGRADYDDVAVMTDEMLAATAEWLPQFPAPERAGVRACRKRETAARSSFRRGRPAIFAVSPRRNGEDVRGSVGEQVPRGFWVAAREEPERVALVDAAGRAWSAGELLAGANQLVHTLPRAWRAAVRSGGDAHAQLRRALPGAAGGVPGRVAVRAAQHPPHRGRARLHPR